MTLDPATMLPKLDSVWSTRYRWVSYVNEDGQTNCTFTHPTGVVLGIYTDRVGLLYGYAYKPGTGVENVRRVEGFTDLQALMSHLEVLAELEK